MVFSAPNYMFTECGKCVFGIHHYRYENCTEFPIVKLIIVNSRSQFMCLVKFQLRIKQNGFIIWNFAMTVSWSEVSDVRVNSLHLQLSLQFSTHTDTHRFMRSDYIDFTPLYNFISEEREREWDWEKWHTRSESSDVWEIHFTVSLFLRTFWSLSCVVCYWAEQRLARWPFLSLTFVAIIFNCGIVTSNIHFKKKTIYSNYFFFQMTNA